MPRLEKMMGSVLLAGALASCGTVRAMDVAPADRPRDGADCGSAGLYVEREACHAKVDARVCASSRLCSTYRAMHEAERRLAALESRLLDDASAAYASYRASDPDHLVDLERAFLLRCRRICCGTKKRRVKTRPTAEAEDGGSRPALRAEFVGWAEPKAKPNVPRHAVGLAMRCWASLRSAQPTKTAGRKER